ncbi:5d794d31-ce40-43e6-99f4-cbd1d8df603b-CDS [Sclerotinia trifoliorum]|uniref:5d794d31-ce40-43e6-99f4-cbd1d8df603b-CDS n=1 Tax=Sclerotinia trifoliorum TaxID=28548 RepID=A0A8H2W369_9HELO|nr:5d794d31-ce40-43e6-99f4-cbd1d8df603b-CDS [Sclerotinia trifoliorum]
MSEHYVPTTSSDSESLIDEPIICFVTDCNYPFGSACQNCAMEFEARAAAKAKARKDAKDGVNKAAAQKLMDMKYQAGRRSEDISERVADIVEDLQAIFAFTQPKPQEPAELTWGNLQIHDSTPAPLKLMEQSILSFGNPSSGNNPTHNQRLNSWLNKLVKRTLDGFLFNSLFSGGADAEDPKEVNCPYCSLSTGEGAWKELHLMKCKYAHEEAKKLEIAREKWSKRRNC